MLRRRIGVVEGVDVRTLCQFTASTSGGQRVPVRVLPSDHVTTVDLRVVIVGLGQLAISWQATVGEPTIAAAFDGDEAAAVDVYRGNQWLPSGRRESNTKVRISQFARPVLSLVAWSGQVSDGLRRSGRAKVR